MKYAVPASAKYSFDFLWGLEIQIQIQKGVTKFPHLEVVVVSEKFYQTVQVCIICDLHIKMNVPMGGME